MNFNLLGETPLHIACGKGYSSIVKLLLDKVAWHIIISVIRVDLAIVLSNRYAFVGG